MGELPQAPCCPSLLRRHFLDLADGPRGALWTHTPPTRAALQQTPGWTRPLEVVRSLITTRDSRTQHRTCLHVASFVSALRRAKQWRRCKQLLTEKHCHLGQPLCCLPQKACSSAFGGSGSVDMRIVRHVVCTRAAQRGGPPCEVVDLVAGEPVAPTLCVLTRRHSLTRAQTGTDSHEHYSGGGSTSLRCCTAATWCCTPTHSALSSCTLAHYASRSGRCWAT